MCVGKVLLLKTICTNEQTCLPTGRANAEAVFKNKVLAESTFFNIFLKSEF